MQRRFAKPNRFLAFLRSAVLFLVKLLASIILLAGMLAGVVGSSAYFASAMPHSLAETGIGWAAMPLTTTLFLFYGFGILQNWMRPYMDQAPKKRIIIVAVSLTLVTSGLVAFASMGAVDDGLMLGLFFSCILVLVVLAHLVQTQFVARFLKAG